MIQINLLPKEARKRIGLGQQIFFLLLILVVTFAGIGFYWSYLNGVIEQKQLEIARTKQRLQELQKIIDKITSNLKIIVEGYIGRKWKPKTFDDWGAEGCHANPGQHDGGHDGDGIHHQI